MKKLFSILLLFSCLALKSQALKFNETIFDDAFKHEAAGGIIAIVTGEIIYQTTNLEGLSSAIGAGAGITITLAKEFIYDKYFQMGVFSLNDIIAGCMGSLTGAMIHRVIIDLRYRHEQKRLIKISNAKRILD